MIHSDAGLVPRVKRGPETDSLEGLETNRRLAADLIDADRVREMLTDDPVYIEQVARTRYYMVRPNEIIYRYRTR